LNAVLFPGGPLPLRIFESRYLDMVSMCMKEERSFGVLLIQSGSETGDVKTVAVGTKARVSDWYQGSDGILGITAIGMERFRLSSCSRQDDGLYVGSVSPLKPERHQDMPDKYRPMGALLKGIIDDLGKLYENIETRYDDATWVGYRFAEILPISLEEQQHCLKIDDAIGRLKFLRPLLRSIRQEMPH
jgi:Lon protease-like protein